MNILLVDDNREILEIVEVQLTDMGHCVVMAMNGEEAIRCVEENEALDLIITDNQMPIMTGSELVMSLIEKKISYPPLILWSGNISSIPNVVKPYVYEILLKGADLKNLFNCISKVDD